MHTCTHVHTHTHKHTHIPMYIVLYMHEYTHYTSLGPHILSVHMSSLIAMISELLFICLIIVLDWRATYWY